MEVGKQRVELPFSVRLGEAREPLLWASALAGETRGTFIRKAVLQRADRMRDELLKNGTQHRREGP